jgi:DNA-binding MarR family transcriptional regulator
MQRLLMQPLCNAGPWQMQAKMNASHRIDLERFVPFRLNRLAAEVSRALARVYGERFGIDIPEWRIIATLGDRGRARAQDIALSTRMHKSMVSRAVARLTDLGWIARTDGAKDRREAPLALTTAGCAVYQQLVPIVLDYQERLLGSLTESERRTLERLLDKLERQLDLPCRPERPRPRARPAVAALSEPSRSDRGP